MIPTRNSLSAPIYDIHQSYADNVALGPFFSGEIPMRPPVRCPVSFLGRTLSSAIGIPAGPLLNSRWISLAARLGFDLLTYKTIRSAFHSGHSFPNMIFVEPMNDHEARVVDQKNIKHEKLTVTNSFGMPSQHPDFLLEDIARALSCLKEGQEMIVSIVGTPQSGVSLIDDFIKTARIALEAGTHFIEANFSCPNVSTSEGMLYLNPEAVEEVARAIVQAIHPVPLIIKVGTFPTKERLRDVLQSAARARVRAVCGINSVSMSIMSQNGGRGLDEFRTTSGVCGAAIRSRAFEWIQDAVSIIQKDRLDLIILGCGGLMEPQHFEECLEKGAAIAMTATAMMWDPYLALRYHWRKEYERPKTT